MRNKIVLRITSVVAAALVCAVWSLGGCSAIGGGGGDPPLAPVIVEEDLKLLSLSVTYQGSNVNLVAFGDGVKDNYMVITERERFEQGAQLVLAYELSEEAEVSEIKPNTVIKYADGGTGFTPENRVYAIGADGIYPVPRPDPEFEIAKLGGVDTYTIIISLVPKEGAVRTENGVTYTYRPRSYAITIMAPEPENIDAPEVKELIEKKIEQAVEKLQSMGVAVGDPSMNDSAARSVSQLVEELNVLRQGTTETRRVESATEPGEGVTYEVENGVYWIIETYQVYDNKEIYNKTVQLSAALENITSEYIIVEQLQLSYKEVVQDVLIGTDGSYEITLEGGGGGHVWTKTLKTAAGGLGGLVTGKFYLGKDTKLGIRTGGEGKGTANLAITGDASLDNNKKQTALRALYDTDPAKWAAAKAGGWNGGGQGGANGGIDESSKWGWVAGSGGGGYSDVRVYDENGELSEVYTYDDADPRIMVAAGGGGAAQLAGTGNPACAGGNAGGNGKASLNGNLAACEPYWPHAGMAPTDKGINGKNGEYRSAGYDGEGRGGGGGGLKGGEAVNVNGYKGYNLSSLNYHPLTGSGAGGSSYVSSQAISSDVGVRSQWGNGSAMVTWKKVE